MRHNHLSIQFLALSLFAWPTFAQQAPAAINPQASDVSDMPVAAAPVPHLIKSIALHQAEAQNVQPRAVLVRRSPLIPTMPGRVIAGTQARAPRASQAPDLTQANYTFLQIDPEGQGQCYIDVHALNDYRQVVVDWSPDCNVYHASLWDNGAWTSLDYVNPDCLDPNAYITSLNNREIAVGAYWSDCPYQPAVGINVKTGKWMAFPDIPDFPYNQGVSMSNTGLAVGGASNDANIVKHWIWNGKEYLFPTFPAGWDVSAFWAGPLFINDWGEIAGEYVDTQSGRQRGYVQSRGKVVTFDGPGDPILTAVNGMTDTGSVLVCSGYDESSPYYPVHNFSLTGGVFTALPDVPYPDAAYTFVFALNTRGDIAGPWVDASGLNHAFVGFRK